MKIDQNFKLGIIILIAVICILLIAFLIRPVKNYIYKPQRYIEYIHPTEYRSKKYVDQVFTNIKTDLHHDLTDISLYDSKYTRDVIHLPNQGMIHIWFYNDTLNHFYIDYSSNPSKWKIEYQKTSKPFPDLKNYQTIQFQNSEIPDYETFSLMKPTQFGFADSRYLLTYPRVVSNVETCFLFNLATLEPIQFFYNINNKSVK